MKFTGRYQIAASPQSVWQGLNDPALLQSCIPGCERMEKTGPAEFSTAVALRIGPMKSAFRGRISLIEQQPPLRCTLTGEMQGGVAGFATGEARLLLSPRDGGTELSYVAAAKLGGQLAELDQRLIDDDAHRIADQFFAAFSAALAPAGVPVAAHRAAQTGDQSGAPLIWMTGLVAVAAILILMFTVVM